MKTIIKNILLLSISLVLLSLVNAPKQVLIIGDSISIGYTPYVVDQLKEEAQVVHNKGNARHTEFGLENLEEWLVNANDAKWDIIHFNFGLHDLCYRGEMGEGAANRDKVNGKLDLTFEEYKQNLEQIVKRLQKTGAKLIFATTTMVPSKEIGRHSSDVEKYNCAAVEVMNRYGVQVNDLYTLSVKFHPLYGRGDNDVHYNKKGSDLFGKQVVLEIKDALTN